MPSQVKVRVSEVTPTTITSAQGKDLNYLVLKGYNETDSKGFSKRFFATKQDGTATKNAEIADSLQPNDWVEVTLDDSSYHNVQTIRKIAAPANTQAPDQTSYKQNTNAGSVGGSKSGGGSRDAGMLNRATALEAAVKLVTSSDNGVSGVNQVIDIATKLETYITYGSGTPSMTMESAGQQPADEQEPVTSDPDLEDIGDDDIPF